jgi:adenylate cyclase
MTSHQVRELSVGFCDLSHFDRAMHELGPEKTLAILARAFDAAGDAVVANGGTIRKYVGDGILFTAESPRAAAAAAKAVAASFKHAEAGLDLHYFVAVATGPVYELEVGHSSLRVPDVYGVTVNDAARLLKKAGADSPDGAFVALCDKTRAAIA